MGRIIMHHHSNGNLLASVLMWLETDVLKCRWMSSGVLFLATCCSTLQEPEGSFQCRKLFALCFRFLLSDVWEQIENRDALGKITLFY